MAITRPQFKWQDAPSTGTGYAFPGNTTAGNVLVAIVTTGGGHTIATGISDTAGNTWQSIANYQQTPNGTTTCDTKIWYTLSCTGGASTVTITGGDNANNILLLLEYAGITSAFLDLSAGTIAPAGTTLTPTSNTFSTTGTSAIVYIWNEQTNAYTTGTPTAGTNFNIVAQNGGQQYVIQDWVNAAQQTSVTASCDLSPTNEPSTNAWTVYMLAFTTGGTNGTVTVPGAQLATAAMPMPNVLMPGRITAYRFFS